MALDVRLSRDVDEPWGFELFGGADEEMPLTIEKIEPDSPAKRAGLLNGDTILTINGEEAIDMSLKTARRRVEKCAHSLTVGVLRGLYDPVLDDSEPLYDYEPDDLGRQSEPTEVVFQIQQFVEPSDIGSKLLDINGSGTLTESRSLTASPYVTSTKPYRPFSTEPVVEVPPLEDPIILNPNYRDQFGKSPIDDDPDYLLNAYNKDALGASRYKLPISEQYDPDGTRFKQNVEVMEKLLKYEKHVKSLGKDLEVVDVTKETKVCDTVTKDLKEFLTKDVSYKEKLIEDIKLEKKGVKISEEISKHEESIKKDNKYMEKKETFREEVEEKSIREELKYIEKMRQDIDLEKIEETATSVVDDSIERAVSVAEEIKKEIDVELSSSEVEKSEEVISESEQKDMSKSVKSAKLQKSSDISDRTESQTKEYAESKKSREERFETQEDATHKIARKDVKESAISEQLSTKDGNVDVHRKSFMSEEYKHEEIRGEPRKQESSAQESFKSEKTSADQRAYTIGLKTIPNIRGVVHSSYHYDLLLRTFFIHLTDVMVALSRFLLSQPIFSQLEQSVSETRTYESGERDLSVRKSTQEITEKVEKRAEEAKKKVVETKQDRRQLVTPVPVAEKKQEVKAVSQKIEKDMKVESVQEKKVEKKEIIKPVPVKEVKVEKLEAKQEQKIEKEMTVSEKKSGSQMAQRSEKKLSQEMTQKMDAVISEFQTVAVEDLKKEMLQKSRRSRSRSQIEEEVMKESDPLEWLSKVDSRRTSQERTEISKKEFSFSETMEKSSKSFVETKQEIKYEKPKTPKQTYVATVEAHVYTNKDAIFEEHLTDISETSSVQSAEEINTAFEAVETVSTENVALESAIHELETAKIVEETHKLATVTAESAATVQKIEEVLHDTKELVQEEFKKETAILSTDVQDVVIQETREIIEPVVEIKESKIDKVEKVAIDINESLSVAESTEVSLEESKSEFKEEFNKETAILSTNAQEVLIQETTEIVEPVIEIKESKIGKVEKVAIDINESFSVAESTEVSVEESKSEFTSVEMKKETVAIVEEERAVEKVVETKPKVIEPKPIETVEISETIKLKPKELVHEESAELKIVKMVEVEGNLSPEIIEVEDISELISKSVVSKVGVSNQLAVDASKEVTEKSFVSSQIGMSASQAKKESMVDISQSAVSSVKKELAVSQQVQSLSKSSEDLIQESTFTAKPVDRNLSLEIELKRQASVENPPSTITTPSPSVPRTPLTDEYVFKLSLPLPRSRSGTPVPRDSTLSPEDEDPNIVKKKLIPHIETSIESVLYDPPLPTPPQSPVYTKPVLNGGAAKLPVYAKPGLKGGAGRVRFPVYRKPGLFGGADEPEYSKEEIREIERKSSLLASAIDETIKSIEEYKEEVGIDTKKEVKIQEYKEEKISKSYQESYSKEIRTEAKQNGFEEIDTKIEEIREQCNALAAIDDVETSEKVEDSESKGIVTEIEEKETRKESIEIKSKLESESIIDEVKTHKEKAVKFENDVQIVEVENVEDKTIEVKRKESLPEEIPTVPEPVPVTPAVEVKQAETELPQTRNVPEVAVEVKTEPARTEKVEEKTEKSDPMLGFRPVVFDPENIQKRGQYITIQEPTSIQEMRQSPPYMTETGELIGTIKGIVDGLEDPVMDEEVAKELGKPGISEEQIACLISGEAEMLREAHVMGLSRVLNSHMHRADDSSVDFQQIKPMIGSLKDSEVIKALNEELARQKAEEKKKEEKKWTTFLQKPKRPVPKAKFGYHGWTEDEQIVAEPYKVKIVKQAKPKVAPDYKPEDFETGPLPWEERAVTESSLPAVEPEEPILIPEVPEFLEAVDPLKESEVPDLEDTGIPLPPPREPTPPPITEEQAPEPEPIPEVQEEEEAQAEDKQETREDMENRMAEQLVRSVQKMVDPNASLDQQLAQMRAQLAALVQLPEVIQQSLELVSKQLSKMSHQEARVETSQVQHQTYQQEATQIHEMQTIQEVNESIEAAQTEAKKNEEAQIEAKKNEVERVTIEEVEDKMETGQKNMQEQENMRMTPMRMTPIMTEEEMRNEKQRKEKSRLEHESRLVKQHPTPRGTKPKRVFGPPDPELVRAVVLPGGRRWKNAEDVYNEQKIKEMFEAHSEPIKGNAIGINFMKYEKPPVSLDHLKNSETFKLVHDMDQAPLKRVELRTPVIAEADYRERCRSMTPSADKKHQQIPQQFHP